MCLSCCIGNLSDFMYGRGKVIQEIAGTSALCIKVTVVHVNIHLKDEKERDKICITQRICIFQFTLLKDKKKCALVHVYKYMPTLRNEKNKQQRVRDRACVCAYNCFLFICIKCCQLTIWAKNKRCIIEITKNFC